MAKTIKYKGEVVSYTTNFTTIYFIHCVDYNFKEKKFNIVNHCEMYETYEDALSVIKKDVINLANGRFCLLHEDSADRYVTRYEDNNGVWKERTYRINCISWNNRDLEKRI